jgi:hypothetical protein
MVAVWRLAGPLVPGADPVPCAAHRIRRGGDHPGGLGLEAVYEPAIAGSGQEWPVILHTVFTPAARQLQTPWVRWL